MVSNPDWMKDSANRATLQSILNSVDYATLSNLKQSREGLLARQKANQQLMLSGKYIHTGMMLILLIMILLNPVRLMMYHL